MRTTTPLRWLVPFVALAVVALAVPARAANSAWLGVYTQEIDNDLRDGLDLSPGIDGVLVNQVVDGSPADHAGLRKGDVILTYNARKVGSPDELRSLVRDSDVGQQVSLSIWRDGGKRDLDVKLSERPDSDDESGSSDDETPVPPRAPRAPHAMEAPRSPESPRSPDAPRAPDSPEIHVWKNGQEVDPDEIRENVRRSLDGMNLKGMEGLSMIAPGRGRLGVRVETLNDDMASALGTSGTHGVLVMQVMDDTPAQKAGLKAGDVIVSVGSTSVSSSEELTRALRSRGEGSVSITVVRRGSRRTIDAQLEKGSEMPMKIWSDDNGHTMRWMDGNPEPGKDRRVYRYRTKDDGNGNGDDSDLRQQLDDLKQQLRELREQMKELKR